MTDGATDDRPETYVQLTLEPTVVGPGQRTEDPYEPGTQLRVKGQRGVFTYKYASMSKSGMVSLHLAQNGAYRAVRPDQVALAKKPRRQK